MAEYGNAMNDIESLNKAEKCFEMMNMIYKNPIQIHIR